MNKLSKYVNLENLKKRSMYEKAEMIVNEVFKNTYDKGGNPYIDHLYYVSNHLDTEEEKVTGLLHDILEDTEITIEDLEEIGISQIVLEALLLVTKIEGETYSDFIDRIINSGNIIALKVKIRDMENNMDISRIKNRTEQDINRIEEKYKPQYSKLKKKIGEYYDRH